MIWAGKLVAPPQGLRVAHAYAALSLLGFLLAAAWPPLFKLLALSSGGSPGLRTLTGFVTHPFVPPSAAAWAWPAGFIYLSAYLLRRVLDDAQQVQLFFGGILAGGVTFLLMAGEPLIFVGGGLAAWAYTGGAVLFGMLKWRWLSWPWRAFVIWMALSLAIRGTELAVPQTALSVAALAGATLVAAWSRSWSSKLGGENLDGIK